MLNNTRLWVIIPNWNGGDLTIKCLESLKSQTAKHSVIVVDNGSSDNSVDLIAKSYPAVELLKNQTNLGFAGGVNVGIKKALALNAKYIVLLNNDVALEKNWLEQMQKSLDSSPEIGSATGKLLSADGKVVDNTGDNYSIWGLSISKDRGLHPEKISNHQEQIFGACAGAGMYKSSAIESVGFFDEKFFAYYEDTDYNFRLQLAGWKSIYCPKAVGYHATGSTSSKISDFTTLQTVKNLPMLFWKNVPLSLLPKLLPRFFVSYGSIVFSSIIKGRILATAKGLIWNIINIPHVLTQRFRIQKNRKVSPSYISSILYKDLPPNARNLRRLRSFFTW